MQDSVWKVLSTANVSAFPDVLDPLRRVAIVHEVPAERETLQREIVTADAYLPSLHIRLDEDCLRRAMGLQVIASPSTGLDHIDLQVARERGVSVLSLKDDREFLDSITATAEVAWGLLLSVVRRIPGASAAAQRGEWSRDLFRGTQLSGKTLGIVGYGRLGRMVANYGRAFRMRVLAHDVAALQPDDGVEMVGFDDVISQSDVLSIHVHLTEETRGLIGAPEFSKMRRGAVLINTSRGAVVSQDALLQSLRTGHLGGAGLDVIDGEWDKDLTAHPLIQLSRQTDRLLITPHIGGITLESQRVAYERIVDKLAAYIVRQQAARR